MVKPFEDAAYALKPGETSGLVESDFGYHIIRLTELRGGQKRGFDAVRPEIEDEVKKQLAAKRFAEAAVDFTNMVYEQSDSLKPVVEKFKLDTAHGQGRPARAGRRGCRRARQPEVPGGALQQGRDRQQAQYRGGGNRGQPARVGPGRRACACAHQLPLAEVSAKVREKVVQVQAAALARKLGEERLAALRKEASATMTGGAAGRLACAVRRDLPSRRGRRRAQGAGGHAADLRGCRPGSRGLCRGQARQGAGARPCGGRCQGHADAICAVVGRCGITGLPQGAEDALQGPR